LTLEDVRAVTDAAAPAPAPRPVLEPRAFTPEEEIAALLASSQELPAPPSAPPRPARARRSPPAAAAAAPRRAITRASKRVRGGRPESLGETPSGAEYWGIRPDASGVLVYVMWIESDDGPEGGGYALSLEQAPEGAEAGGANAGIAQAIWHEQEAEGWHNVRADFA